MILYSFHVFCIFISNFNPFFVIILKESLVYLMKMMIFDLLNPFQDIYFFHIKELQEDCKTRPSL